MGDVGYQWVRKAVSIARYDMANQIPGNIDFNSMAGSAVNHVRYVFSFVEPAIAGEENERDAQDIDFETPSYERSVHFAAPHPSCYQSM